MSTTAPVKKPFLNTKGYHGHGSKKRRCLRCDRYFNTTPEIRICSVCKTHDSEYMMATAGLEYGKQA